jgi:hypothetical protein
MVSHYGRSLRTSSVGQYIEERVIYAERFQARTLDFRGRFAFVRYDECEFVKCEILIDDHTEDWLKAIFSSYPSRSGMPTSTGA